MEKITEVPDHLYVHSGGSLAEFQVDKKVCLQEGRDNCVGRRAP